MKEKHSLNILYPGTDVDASGQDFAGSNDSAGDIVGIAAVPFKCRLDYVGCRITETCAGGTTTPVIKVWEGGTGGTLRATLTLSTTASGYFAYEQAASNIDLEPGDTLEFEMDVKATGASAAGKGLFVAVVDYIPELVSNATYCAAV